MLNYPGESKRSKRRLIDLPVQTWDPARQWFGTCRLRLMTKSFLGFFGWSGDLRIRVVKEREGDLLIPRNCFSLGQADSIFIS